MAAAQHRRDLLLEQGVEERVETNTRHLIDKILARYSAEYTIYRELVQNSNDAGATHVKIEFTCSSLPPSSSVSAAERPSSPAPSSSLPTHCTAITYKNNGRVFRDEDWRRLKSIAEGNPDETKVGFFGVGFYSLFSVCEEPFVRSGDKCLGFFWKGDQLFAKRAEIPPASDQLSEEDRQKDLEERKWTAFEMQLREPMEIPRVNDFSKFLATCLSFTETLTHIDTYLNLGPPANEVKHVISLAKTLSPDLPLSLPPNTRRTSPQSLFSLDHIDLRNVQITAKLLQEVEEKEEQSLTSKVALWFGVAKPKPPKPKEFKWVQCSIFLRVARATVLVKSSTQLQTQMERTTKKRVPGKVTMSAVYNTADEFKLSQELAVESRVFEDLVPYPRQGNVFIGFKTHQTTGCSVHLASHFIPTVERENMDFVDPTLAFWNQELTSMGGTLCRVLFDTEIAQTHLRSDDALDVDRYTHIVNSFTCHPSTPAATVSQLVSRAFFLASSDELVLLSTRGLKPVSQVRMYDSTVAAFLLDELPMLAKPVYDAAKPFFDLLLDARLLKPVTVADVFQALPAKIDNDDRIASVWQWAIASRSALANHHVITLKSRTPYTRFAPARWFPPSAPMPEDVMPNALAKRVEEHQLRWLGYNELSVVDWAQFIADKGLLTTFAPATSTDASTAHSVVDLLGILARAVPNLPATQSALILSLLASLKCMPTTTHGLVLPADTYLPATSASGPATTSGMFSASDLPMLTPHAAKKLPHAFLQSLGVRDHIDPHLILSRLDSLNWTPAQLVAYFARESRLDDVDVAKIAAARVFEGRRSGKVVERQKYLASELVMPHAELEALDVVQVHGLPEPMVRSGSKEWRFLVRLGMKRGVDAKWVVQQASSEMMDGDRRVALLLFALEKGEVGKLDDRETAYLPTATAGAPLVKSLHVFTDPACAVLGFAVLDPRLASAAEKLGVAKHPPVDQVLAQLQAKPLDKNNARAVLEYLAGRAPELGQRALASLSALVFLPTANGSRAPKDVYLKPFPLLPHVDFGDTANQFLRLCGVKDEPTPVEMAEWLLAHGAASVYADRPGEYLDVLTKVAFHLSTIPAQVLRRLASAPVLVGFQGSKQMLVAAADVYLVDDPVLQTIFSPVTCPMDPTLEAFYEHLGARWLGSVIDRRYDVAWAPGRGQAGDPSTPRAKGLQAKITERAPLLVHDLNASKNIQVNALAQLQAVQVQEVTRIDLVREFLGKKHVQGVSAAMASKSVLLVAAVTAGSGEASGEMDYFDVARCLSGLIFKRPKLNDQLLLSTLLSTSLDALRMKGFPVDRILKITPKLAEAAQKQKVIPPTPKPAPMPAPTPVVASASPAPNGKATPVTGAGVPPSPAGKANESLPPPSYEDATGGLPGALKRNPGSEAGLNGNNTPPTPTRQSLFDKVKSSSPRDSLMNLVNNALGAAASSSLSSSSSQYPGSSSTPPPTKQQPQQGPSPASANQPSTGQPSQPPPGTRMLREGTPEFDAQLQSTLQSAIRASSIAAAPGTVVANPPQLAQAQNTYCDMVSAGHDLVEVSQGFLPVKLYRGRSHSDTDLIANGPMRSRLIEFAGILMLLADVFGLPARALHMYVDEQAQSVAFNRGRALFFNASRYLPAAGSSKAYTYWFMVFAHELAHNHVAAHNADHEFYMASYASVYMTKLMVVLLGLGIDLATPE